MRNVSDKAKEKIETHILCSVTFFPKILVVYELIWKNMLELDSPQMTV